MSDANVISTKIDESMAKFEKSYEARNQVMNEFFDKINLNFVNHQCKLITEVNKGTNDQNQSKDPVNQIMFAILDLHQGYQRFQEINSANSEELHKSVNELKYFDNSLHQTVTDQAIRIGELTREISQINLDKEEEIEQAKNLIKEQMNNEIDFLKTENEQLNTALENFQCGSGSEAKLKSLIIELKVRKKEISKKLSDEQDKTSDLTKSLKSLKKDYLKITAKYNTLKLSNEQLNKNLSEKVRIIDTRDKTIKNQHKIIDDLKKEMAKLKAMIGYPTQNQSQQKSNKDSVISDQSQEILRLYRIVDEKNSLIENLKKKCQTNHQEGSEESFQKSMSNQNCQNNQQENNESDIINLDDAQNGQFNSPTAPSGLTQNTNQSHGKDLYGLFGYSNEMGSQSVPAGAPQYSVSYGQINQPSTAENDSKITELRNENESLKRKIVEKDNEIKRQQNENQSLQQANSRKSRPFSSSSSYQKQIAEKDGKIGMLEDRNRSLMKENAILKESNDEKQSQIKQLTKDNSRKEEENRNLNQKVLNQKADNDKLANEKKALEEECKNQKREIKNLKSENEKLQKKVNKNASIFQENETLKSDIENMKEIVSALEQEKRSLDTQINEAKEKSKSRFNLFNSQIDEEKNKADEKLNKMQTSISNFENACKKFNDAISTLQKENECQKFYIDELKVQIEEIQTKKNKLETDYMNLEKEANVVKNSTGKLQKLINDQRQIIRKQMYLAKTETELQVNKMREIQKTEIDTIFEIFS